MKGEALPEIAALRQEIEELRLAVRARDDFIAIAAHELRNPMTPILGMTEIALRGVRNAKGVSPQRMITLLEALQSAVQSYVERATRLLDISRIAAGNLRLESSPNDLTVLVLSIARRYEAVATRTNSTLNLDLEDGVISLCDPHAVEQVVENLISNALKFGIGKPVTVQLRSDEKSASLSVRDRGIGIPHDQQERIFGQFEQVITQHQGTGFGVGLWVANRLVRAMNGQIAVSSDPGKGSTFTVTLPLSAPTGSSIIMTQAESETDKGDIERVQSHVSGLDAVLSGGFLGGGLYLIQGPPGTGKTILASQIIYSRAAEGNTALFITVLGENHGRMLTHLRRLRFFDPVFIPDRVTYISAYAALEDEGLDGVTALILREVRARKATTLVLDGMSAVTAKAGATADFGVRRFTHELQTLASATNCTMFLLTTASGSASTPEHTMVDGLIELRQRPYGVRNERRLIVHKFRGSDFLEGEHAFRITAEGVTVFPRTEALLAMPTRRDPPPRQRISSGVPSLDAMFGGGIPKATVTALVGPSGAGKTTVGLHFLSLSSAAEPGLLFGCYETPERLHLRAENLGIDLTGAEQRGDLEIVWFPIGEHILDELAHRLLDAVRRRGVKRLVIDGISGFQQAALDPERIVRFWSALSHELRALHVTTLHTLEMPEIMGLELRVPVSGMPSLSEVMVLLRYVELESRLFRLISMFKVRDGAFDPAIREFEITDRGFAVGDPFKGVEAVLSGLAARSAAVRSSENGESWPGGDTGQPG